MTMPDFDEQMEQARGNARLHAKLYERNEALEQRVAELERQIAHAITSFDKRLARLEGDDAISESS
jgi:hypothetical protein